MGDMVEVFKHINYYDKQILNCKLNPHTRPMRRHGFELQRNFGNDGLRGVQTNSFYYRCIKQWNDLPEEVVNSTSLPTFKKRLTKTWTTHL